ncbi:MAG: hypothetical protein ACOX1I_04935 [Dethiobacteria bacterium]
MPSGRSGAAGTTACFAFVDQQPPALRPSLFEKDDDYRLSFFHGNYITLTNMGELDIKRIIRRGISPLYISIHSTDPTIRRKDDGKPFCRADSRTTVPLGCCGDSDAWTDSSMPRA